MIFVLYLWALPNTLVGFLLALPYLSNPMNWRWRDGVLEATCRWAIGSPGAQTWGWLVFAVGDRNRERLAGKLGWHERKHTKDSLIWGVFFLLAYGGEFLGRYLFKPGTTPYSEASFWIGHGWPIGIAEERSRRPRYQARWFRAYWNLSWEKRAREQEEKGHSPFS